MYDTTNFNVWRTFARRWVSIRIGGFSQKRAAPVLALLAVRARYEDPRTLPRGLAYCYGASRAQIHPDKVAPIVGTHQTGGTRACPHQFARLVLARHDERMTLISVSKCLPINDQEISFKRLVYFTTSLIERETHSRQGQQDLNLWALGLRTLFLNLYRKHGYIYIICM